MEDYPLQLVTQRVLFVQDAIRNEGIVRMPLNASKEKREALADFLRMLAQHLDNTAALLDEYPNYNHVIGHTERRFPEL
jgi:hypothetical protein